MNIVSIIDSFHVAPKATDSNRVDFVRLNQISVKLGYFIHPDCCTKDVIDWLNTKTINYNATFYKSWNDVITKNRFELFVDQIMHYATTYGTDFNLGNGYVPNDGAETPEFKDMKVILPITVEDLCKRCLSMLESGIALKDSTMKTMADYVLGTYKANHVKINLDNIKNREAQAYLGFKLHKFPSDEFGILRCLMYIYTGKCSVIKNKSTIMTVKVATRNFPVSPLSFLTETQMIKLSRIFLRYKPIFLAMKTKDSASVVNKLNKLAKQNHTPMQIGFWESIIAVAKDFSEIKARLSEISNFKKVRLLQAINVALFSKETDKVYVIRNGKSFTRQNYRPYYDKDYLRELKTVIENSLIESLKRKACKVSYPSHISLTLPSSEKSFVGNIPFGSHLKIGKSGIVGIYWTSEWNTMDYDLSMTDYTGNYIGWCGSYYYMARHGRPDDTVIFSGDMTNADPCATELMYVNGEKCPNAVVHVNQYNGDPISKFRFFVATEDLSSKKNNMKNYMVDPNNIRFETMIDIDQSDGAQKIVGLVSDDEFYFMDLVNGKNRVARPTKYNISFINTMANRSGCYVDLKDILTRAGFVETEDDPDIDFNNLEKDTLINLLK